MGLSPSEVDATKTKELYVAVRIRMKRLGRLHRPYYRICAVDSRAPRDGRVLEQLGTYDPMIADVDARAVLNNDRIKYWIGVGALPSDRVGILIKKYGAEGTCREQQKTALERLAQSRKRPGPRSTPVAVQSDAPAPEPSAEASGQ